MEHLTSSSWTDIDRTRRSGDIVDYLDLLRSQPPFLKMKRRTYELVWETSPGRVLDVGCGTGADAVELARGLPGKGRVVGIDRSQELIAEARNRAPRDVPVEFHQGDATNLRMPDDAFDVVRTDRVLQHLDHPEQGLGEMIRVTRSGGRVVVSDVDHGGLMIDSSHPVLMERIHRFVQTVLAHPWIGRQLPAMFQDAGLRGLSVEVQAGILSWEFIKGMVPLADLTESMARARVLTRREAETIVADLESRAAGGRWFAAIPLFILCAEKP